MDYLRHSVLTILWEILQLGPVALDDDAVSYKQWVLMVAGVANQANLVEKLYKYAPVDWRSAKFVFPASSTKAEAFVFLRDNVIPILFGHQPYEYNTRKWLGWEYTRRDTLLPSLINNLLPQGFRQHVARNHFQDLCDQVEKAVARNGGATTY